MYKTIAMTLAVAASTTGCYAKKKDVQAEFAAVRREMQQSDQMLKAENTQTAQALAATEQRLNTKIDAVARDVQRLTSQLNDLNVKVTNLNGLIAFALPVYFDFDKADLRDSDRAVLKRFANVIKEFYPGAILTAEGFADPVGNTAYNKKLGLRRADAVKSYLISDGGVDQNAVRTVSYGEDKNRAVQLGSSNPKDSHAAHRRVVIVLDYVGTAANAVRVITE